MFYQENLVFPSDGADNYRIPSLIVTNSGTALAFCSNRIGSIRDAAEEMDLVYAVKKPGQAWSQVRILDHLDGWRSNIDGAVYDSQADKAIILFQRQPMAIKEFGNYTPEEIEQLERQKKEATLAAEAKGIFTGPCRMASTDDGETFTEEKHHVTPVLLPQGTNLFQRNPRQCITQQGCRNRQPFLHRPSRLWKQ